MSPRRITLRNLSKNCMRKLQKEIPVESHGGRIGEIFCSTYCEIPGGFLVESLERSVVESLEELLVMNFLWNLWRSF